ncbi:glycosyltransferase [Qipengyuania sp. 1NDW9]|uniref:glycosyltransferase family 4 protein n=1 Tax=Qipengyuania xiapuensis TaxID=2867236 RepID=UPI001C879FA3|nr:glycosyltransferase [Qipengyuania xiapuensis]MBX7492582.1 glycosyltransferase [Qipengyuania xiapuensis]
MSKHSDGIPPHVLHVCPDREAMERIASYGRKLRHTVVTGDELVMQAAPRGLTIKQASHFPSLQGLPSPGRMQKLARAMTPFDLVLTHGWDALDVAMAHTLFKDAMQLPPLVHHESDLGEKEAVRLSKKRTWYRRIALGKSSGLVVPSEKLEEIALVDWQQPLGRVKRIAPGVDTKAFAKKPKTDGFRMIKREGERWLGTHAASGDLPTLASAFAALGKDWQLIILGEGDRSEIEPLVDRMEMNDRVHWLGSVGTPEKVFGLFDIFAVAGHADGFPVPVVQAMASGVPVVAPDDGEIAHTVAEPTREQLFQHGNEAALTEKLVTLSRDPQARRDAGEANRAHAVAAYDREKSLATYRRLYGSAMQFEL